MSFVPPSYNINPSAPNPNPPSMHPSQSQSQSQSYSNNINQNINHQNNNANHHGYQQSQQQTFTPSSASAPSTSASQSSIPDISPSSSSSPLSSSPSSSSASLPLLPRIFRSLSLHYVSYLDWSVPQSGIRYAILASLMLIYMLRVYFLQGFYIVTYGLGIFLLNLLIGFLSPLDEDSMDSLDDGSEETLLPMQDKEFKPFIRRLPEFKFWYSCCKALCFSLVLTFFPIFDLPVFWPILLIYFCILFFLTMKRQIKHMMKHKYLPFNLGKKTYGQGNGVSIEGITKGAANILSAAQHGVGSMIGQKGKQPHEDIRSR